MGPRIYVTPDRPLAGDQPSGIPVARDCGAKYHGPPHALGQGAELYRAIQGSSAIHTRLVMGSINAPPVAREWGNSPVKPLC